MTPPPTIPTSRSNLINKVSLAVYIIILIFVFFNNYNQVFDKKINLGGDNAGYYILGNSLASGQGYKNIHIKEKTAHNHFPPGYPLIIAAASKIYSTDIIYIKKVNGFFLFLSIGMLFFLFYKLTGNYHIPFITSLYLLYNLHLLNYSFIMMSEIPFLFFSTLSIFLFIKTDFSLPIKKNWLFLILIACISFTYYIRSTGLALVVSFSLILLLKKNWKYLLTLVMGFVIFVLPWYIRSKSLGGNSYISQLFLKNPYNSKLGVMDLGDWFTRIWVNFERYISREIPSGVIDFINISNYRDPINAEEWIIGLVIMAVMVYGLVRLTKHMHLILYYVIANFGLLLLWPDVWYGTRFMLHLIPLLTLFLINGFASILLLLNRIVLKKENQLLVFIPLVVLSVSTINFYGETTINKLNKLTKANYPKNYQDYFELAEFVNSNTPDTTVVCCRKGQLFYLFSNRYVASIKRTTDYKEQIEYLKNKDVNYVVLDNLGFKDTGKYLLPIVKKQTEIFLIIKKTENTDSYLFDFLPEFGYSGEWENNNSSGTGRFKWRSGTRFSGQWENNLRNGEGTLYFLNGNYLEGTWINDTLNGKGIIYSKDGLILEQNIYKNNLKIGSIVLKD